MSDAQRKLALVGAAVLVCLALLVPYFGIGNSVGRGREDSELDREINQDTSARRTDVAKSRRTPGAPHDTKAEPPAHSDSNGSLDDMLQGLTQR